ncbi:hypothetical protein P175DRAFT_0504715 [Aspergillus ochraceoroseus IBT 24754]|uniref:Calcofluor white hypersensitive protein n=1 Tax=Aspergillus ochraceoroseus IBT 24754 TaxID=1392256 RepID=A0A2T5LMB8_9EURO|nr:uncharacterized protein P175DRAFT_0504715 [Aspergillus ochraceoroseus IBT 24754]PTU17423.1 hypothetical protein P175DRAFT_0504715 [Aspergillus ochraceoroseus IBT 24754]
MSGNRTGLYLGVAVAGAGAYYLYRAGGDPKAAKDAMKHDANKARNKVPGAEDAERARVETKLNLEEAGNNIRAKADDITAEGKKKLDELRQEGEEKMSQVRSEVEERADEAKSSLSGWFGGKK